MEMLSWMGRCESIALSSMIRWVSDDRCTAIAVPIIISNYSTS